MTSSYIKLLLVSGILGITYFLSAGIDKILEGDTNLLPVQEQTYVELAKPNESSGDEVPDWEIKIPPRLSEEARELYAVLLERLQMEQTRRGEEPYLDSVNEILGITGLSWEVQIAQMFRESSLIPSQKSPSEAIGFLKLKKIAYDDVVEGYEHGYWGVREVLAGTGVEPTKTWDELFSEWNAHPDDTEIQKELLYLSAAYMHITRERIESYLSDFNVSEDFVESAVLDAYKAGFRRFKEAHTYSGHSTNIDDVHAAFEELGEHESAEYSEKIFETAKIIREILRFYDTSNLRIELL